MFIIHNMKAWFESSLFLPRPWMQLAPLDRNFPTALFTVMCYNVLCDRYATRYKKNRVIKTYRTIKANLPLKYCTIMIGQLGLV